MIKSLCSEQMQEWRKASGAAMWLANNSGMVNASVPKILNALEAAHRLLAPKPLQLVNKVTDQYVPAWNPFMPKGAAPLREPTKPAAVEGRSITRKVGACAATGLATHSYGLAQHLLRRGAHPPLMYLRCGH
jgi:D-lactate dehydrogenase